MKDYYFHSHILPRIYKDQDHHPCQHQIKESRCHPMIYRPVYYRVKDFSDETAIWLLKKHCGAVIRGASANNVIETITIDVSDARAGPYSENLCGSSF